MQVTPSILRYAAAGVLAAAAGMAVGHLAATVVEPAASPVTAIGAVVVDATPTPVKEWAVATLGTADKPILIATVVLVTVVLSAGIGLLARRWRAAGLVLLVVLVTLAGLAAVGRPSAGQLAVVPSLLAGLTGVIAVTWLCRLADLQSEPAGSGQFRHRGRRHRHRCPDGRWGGLPGQWANERRGRTTSPLAERACSSLAAWSRDDDAGDQRAAHSEG